MPSRIVKVTQDALPPVIYTGFAPDVLAMLLADKRSESTRRAYDRDIRDFFAMMFRDNQVFNNLLKAIALTALEISALVDNIIDDDDHYNYDADIFELAYTKLVEKLKSDRTYALT
jgi:hypothetical protein